MEIMDGKKLADYIAQSTVPVHLQEDGTIALMFEADVPLVKAVESVKCPYCDKLVREHQPPVKDTVRGLYLRCPGCNQRFFVHLYVPFGGTPG